MNHVRAFLAIPARAAALACIALAATSCGSKPPPPPAAPCDHAEVVEIQLRPHAQLNPDREGYPRSVVTRVYQLENSEAFGTAVYEDLWSEGSTGATAPSVVSGPEELTLIPGRVENRAFKRNPKATHVAVAAKFREHHADSGWRGTYALPAPRDACKNPVSARIYVELVNYSLRVR